MGVAMRGDDLISGSLFSYIDLEERVRADHPLRAIREIANAALAVLSRDFAALYSGMGRPSIAPEKLLRATLLQAFYSVRSERQLMERLEFDLLFRWFVGIGSCRSAPCNCDRAGISRGYDLDAEASFRPKMGRESFGERLRASAAEGYQVP